jgi:membrane protease YdiL (CAAX protease family)
MTPPSFASHLGTNRRFILLLEVFLIYSLVLWSVWSSHLSSAVLWFKPAIAFLLLYLALVIPLVQTLVIRPFRSEGDKNAFFEARGIGNPFSWLRPDERLQTLATLPKLVFTLTLASLLAAGLVAITQEVDNDKLNQALAIGIPLILLPGGCLLLFFTRWDNFVAALRSIIGIVLVGIVLLVGANWGLRLTPDLVLLTDETPAQLWEKLSVIDLVGRFFLYLPWSWLQMYFFLGVIQVSIARALGNHEPHLRWITCFVTGFLFALIHLPNIWLFMVTLIAGIYLAYCYQRTPNIFVMAIAHAFLACLFNKLLPFSLSPMIKSYNGPVELYEWARVFVFASLPILLVLCVASLKGLRKSVVAVACGAALLSATTFPDGSSGPSFSWARYGNGHTWSRHALEITERNSVNTAYKSKAESAYFISQPLNLVSERELTLELVMSVTGARKKARGYVFFDIGEGFETSPIRPYPLSIVPGMHTYTITLPYSGQVTRLQITPSVESGVNIVMRSLTIQPN